MIDLLSIATGWALLAVDINRPRITVVNATSQAMTSVVLEIIQNQSQQKKTATITLGDLPAGQQIKSDFNADEPIETVLVRYRNDDMESTFSCGPVVPGEHLILTNDTKGVTCDFK
jgi:hypothetical protein